MPHCASRSATVEAVPDASLPAENEAIPDYKRATPPRASQQYARPQRPCPLNLCRRQSTCRTTRAGWSCLDQLTDQVSRSARQRP